MKIANIEKIVKKIFLNFNLSKKHSKLCAKYLVKAELVGANTVKGPSPFKASTNPAAFTAATKVEKSLLEAAIPTIDFF